MAEVANTSVVVKAAGRWNPSDLSFIHNLEYQCADANRFASIRILGVLQRRDLCKNGWPSDACPRFEIQMLFERIEALELQGFGDTPKQISGFDIVDISDHGLENISFRIEDYEDGALQFYCKTVSIVGITPKALT